MFDNLKMHIIKRKGEDISMLIYLLIYFRP